MQIEYAKVSATGDRDDNQDRADIVVAEDAVLMLVFDGMGGHADGAGAAETGLRVVRELFTSARLPIFDAQGFLYAALARAHDAVVNMGREVAVDFRPRATCAACLVQESGSFWAHIGDSRIYHFRNGRMLTRSRDHSHVEMLIQEGAISEDEAADHPMRNFVECCIGGDVPVPDMTISRKYELQPGDTLLVCSDGLWSGLDAADIAALGTPNGADLGKVLEQVSLNAIKANAPQSDNTTGTVLRWLGP